MSNHAPSGSLCLWKKSKPGEPAWEAPFGTGRPGWHIEDTAIAEKYFGPQYDIHGGAIDLIFPHHEAEVTQMEALSGKTPLVRFWMHAGFLNIDSQKMLKSLGNYKTIRSVLKSYDYRVLRLLFIGSHWRVWDFFQEMNSFMDIFRFDREVGDAYIRSLIQKRARYRAEKDFSRADVVRNELLKMGVKVYDSQEETKYRK